MYKEKEKTLNKPYMLTKEQIQMLDMLDFTLDTIEQNFNLTDKTIDAIQNLRSFILNTISQSINMVQIREVQTILESLT